MLRVYIHCSVKNMGKVLICTPKLPHFFFGRKLRPPSIGIEATEHSTATSHDHRHHIILKQAKCRRQVPTKYVTVLAIIGSILGGFPPTLCAIQIHLLNLIPITDATEQRRDYSLRATVSAISRGSLCFFAKCRRPVT